MKRNLDKTKCVSFSINDEKNIMTFGKNSATSSKMNLTVNLYTLKNM